MTTETTQGWDTWFPRVVKLTSFALGAGIIVYEVVLGHQLTFALLGVAVSGMPLPYWFAKVWTEGK